MIIPEVCPICGSDNIYFNEMYQQSWCSDCDCGLEEEPKFNEIDTDTLSVKGRCGSDQWIELKIGMESRKDVICDTMRRREEKNLDIEWLKAQLDEVNSTIRFIKELERKEKIKKLIKLYEWDSINGYIITFASSVEEARNKVIEEFKKENPETEIPSLLLEDIAKDPWVKLVSFIEGGG